MTQICDLALENVRVLHQVRLAPGAGVNLIGGANGAGKTSLLEAIYLAGRGRTFRHPEAGPLIRRGCESAQIVLRIAKVPGGDVSVLGVRRGRTEFECRFDGAVVRRRSELAAVLPILFLSSTPQTLLGSGPDTRRRFLDMAMFHVEPDYLVAYSAWARALRQRNAAVGSESRDELDVWDARLVSTSEAVTDRRREMLALLAGRATVILQDEFGLDLQLAMDYRVGWSSGISLDVALRNKRAMDLERGFTSVGPHRADVRITSGGQPADRSLSRGQLKLLVLAMNLALIDRVLESSGLEASPVVLIDDLGSELDLANQRRAIQALRIRGVQAFVALLEPAAVIEQGSPDRVFHVEQGSVC